MEGPLDDASLARLNNELLKEAPHETKEAPKRNSKQDLIKKLIDLCEEQGLELEHSDTKLRRMTKAELNALLAQKVQQSIKRQMADQVAPRARPTRSSRWARCAWSTTCSRVWPSAG